MLHRIADLGGHAVRIFARTFDEQLVMDGQNHAGIGLFQPLVQVQHGSLQNVGRGALNRKIHGHPLARHADLRVLAAQLGHHPPPAEHRFHETLLARLLNRPIDEDPHAREAAEVGVDELLSRRGRDADVARQRERRLAVKQRIVDDLRPPPELVFVEPAVGAEHLQRSAVVNILAAGKRLHERFFFSHVRQHAKLDLRVVGGDQHEPRIGDEGAPDFAPQVGANRNVLQVRIAAAQAAGRRHRLVERGVHPCRARMDELRQCIDVGALQFHERAPLENQSRQVVRERELFQHIDRR